MTIYTGPVFDMARRQFDVIADYLEIAPDERPRLLYPKRAVIVSCPIHRDDGGLAVFEGYWVRRRAARDFRSTSTSARSPRSRSG
jgi:glutamate dehydrogenase (NAD(P)+)